MKRDFWAPETGGVSKAVFDVISLYLQAGQKLVSNDGCWDCKVSLSTFFGKFLPAGQKVSPLGTKKCSSLHLF
jgi:hypothetical protein